MCNRPDNSSRTTTDMRLRSEVNSNSCSCAHWESFPSGPRNATLSRRRSISATPSPAADVASESSSGDIPRYTGTPSAPPTLAPPSSPPPDALCPSLTGTSELQSARHCMNRIIPGVGATMADCSAGSWCTASTVKPSPNTSPFTKHFLNTISFAVSVPVLSVKMNLTWPKSSLILVLCTWQPSCAASSQRARSHSQSLA
mmetsp:Transcript_21307/g.46405  ORF Transcript_21307/g.46405 Transcript_21307/m.46405 type:complete len:200 (-) Transcript_21307:323-922(-)